jgi:hypothetical protein
MKDHGRFTPKSCSIDKQKQAASYLGNKINNFSSDQKTPHYTLLQRAFETLVLFHKCPNLELIATLKSSGYLIGVLLSSKEFNDCPSLSNFDYAYIGTQGYEKPSITYVIRDLSFKGWSKIDDRHIL